MPTYLGMPAFPDAAKRAVANSQLRRNLTHATTAIRTKRAKAVAELDDWEQLRQAAKAIKDHTLANLGTYLVRLEENVTRAGGHVHWARDAAEANAIVADLVRQAGADKAVKVKSMATQETGLNEHLEENGIAAIETDLAELIVQLGEDKPSHILVPAIHRNRAEIREIFLKSMPGIDPDITDDPRALAMAARAHLRRKFLSAKVAVSGANFGVAETGTLAVVESEGNGRMCLTLPDTLITLMGIEKLVPSFTDLEVFMQLLPRSSTAERMNPYTSMWTGVHPGDGPQNFHVVLLDNGRTNVLADEVGRSALHCIRCSACLNVCPVYERAGGHAYGSVYPGPIGAILSPQLTGTTGHDDPNASLPFASTLCGACFDACPVRIDIPGILVHLRAEQVDSERHGLPGGQDLAMKAAGFVMGSEKRFAAAETVSKVGRVLGGKKGRITSLPYPGSKWTGSRDLPAPPKETFRQWWARTHEDGEK
jgi:L-lactate dehydrogenase complex protein LldF